jgi:hypothetical protein
MRKNLQSPQRQMRLMALKLTGTGTAALGEGSTLATLVDNGTGDYTLTFAEPFGRAPLALASSLTSNTITQVSAISATAMTIKAFSGADGTTAKDAVLDIIVIGSEVADQT